MLDLQTANFVYFLVKKDLPSQIFGTRTDFSNISAAWTDANFSPLSKVNSLFMSKASDYKHLIRYFSFPDNLLLFFFLQLSLLIL